MNPYDGSIDGRLGTFGYRQGRQAGIGDEQKRKQRAANEYKITHEGHFRHCSIRTAARHRGLNRRLLYLFLAAGKGSTRGVGSVGFFEAGGALRSIC
jgi:hypothetical protein